jgi:predicted dinucleotide-binding enzyme
MAIIGLIGSGHIGSTVARLAVDAGHEVVLSNSRGPDTLAYVIEGLGPLARAATPREAAAVGEIVVISVPVKAVTAMPATELDGKVVIDTGNYYPQRDGRIRELDDGLAHSAYLARHVPGAQVVKAFNNIFFKHLLNLARPVGAADQTYLPIAGDDAAAKQTVTSFLDSIGYGVVDAGTLADSWRQQPHTPVYGAPYGQTGDEKGLTASEALIRSALSWAVQGLSGGAAGDLVGPDLAADPHRRRRLPAGPLGRRTVSVREGGGLHPGIEGVVVPPAGDHQPGRPVVGGLEQLKALEAVLVVHGPGPGGETARQFVTGVGWYGDRVDLHHSHGIDLFRSGSHGVHLPTVNDGCHRLSGQNSTEMPYWAQLCRKLPPTLAADGMCGGAVFTNTPIRM